jgi:dephospho-CoA kinase
LKIIGLTGGIASGKSTAARTLRELGAIVIDADEVSRFAVEPGQPAWREIVEFFGRDILNPNNTINREKLGLQVFSQPEYLKKLNQITHPHIMEDLSSGTAVNINALNKGIDKVFISTNMS